MGRQLNRPQYACCGCLQLMESVLLQQGGLYGEHFGCLLQSASDKTVGLAQPSLWLHNVHLDPSEPSVVYLCIHLSIVWVWGQSVRQCRLITESPSSPKGWAMSVATREGTVPWY